MPLSDRKIAFVHYCLVNMRGAERVLDFFCELFPDADIFTLACDPARVPDRIRRHRITTSFIQKLPLGVRMYRHYLPLHPLAFEQFDLSAYDLVITFQSGVVNNVILAPETCHICYCHTPVRYLWNMYHEYKKELPAVARWPWAFIAGRLRLTDYASAQRVDCFIANSQNVRRRIRRYYGREADVLYPPVSLDLFHTGEPGDFYLAAGQLHPYKRVDLAVEAFNSLGKKLVVIGEGPQRRRLEKIAGPGITFLGRVPDEVLADYYARCRGLIFPGEEDFGLTPLEAMASGKPVIAFGRGGALETVQPGRTGVLFSDQTVAALMEAVARAEATSWDPAAIRAFAAGFSRENMRGKYSSLILSRYEAFRAGLDPDMA